MPDQQNLASLIISIIILIIVIILIVIVCCNMYNTNNTNTQQPYIQNPKALAAAAIYNKNKFYTPVAGQVCQYNGDDYECYYTCPGEWSMTTVTWPSLKITCTSLF